MVKKWLAVFAVAGMVLAGCGSEADDDSNGNATTEPTSDTTAAPAGDLITAENFAERVVGAQYEAGSFEVAMEMTIEGQAMGGSGVMRSGDTLEETQMQLTMEVPGAGAMEMRMVDGVMYMEIPDMGWMSMDLAEAAESMGMDTTLFDPAAQTEAFSEALVSLEPSGDPEEIDGVQAQPYTLVVDAQQLTELEGFEDLEGVDEQMEIEMWIGPDDLPRRMVMDMDGEVMTMTMSNWGTDVTVEAPPADEVTDFGDMMG